MTKFKQQSNVLFLRMLFLLAMVLTGSSASWADNYLVLKPSITIGNENGWAGDHIDASFFADIKANDVIEISKVSGTNSALQVSAGTWDNSVQLFNEYNWNGETQYIRILAPSSSSSSNDDIVNLIKTNGLIVNGNGPCNIKVRLILVGDNRLSPSGTFSKTGITNNVAQIGDAVTYKYTLDSKFANAENVKYRWFIVNQSETEAPELPEGDGYVYGYNQMLNGYKWGTSNTFTFIPRESTAGKKLRVCLHVEADGLSTNYTYDNSGDFTIAPMQTPAIVQDGTSVKITVPANHWLKYSINGGSQVSVYANTATVPVNIGDVVQAWTYRTVTQEGKSDEYPYSESVSYRVIGKHPNITCENGTVDLSKVYAYGDASFDGSTFKVNSYSQYGNGLKIEFENPQDLSNAKSITINGAEFNNVPIDDKYPAKTVGSGKTVINLNNKNNDAYKNVSVIYLRDIAAGTYTINSIVVDFDHTPATPQFTNGTTASMRVVAGTKLKLHATTGWWREYTEFNGNNETAAHGVATNTYTKDVEVTTTADDAGKILYFAAQDYTKCEFNKGHASNPKNWVALEVETPGEIPTGFKMIKQPIYNEYHSNQAKEYIAIAELTASDGNKISCGWEGNASGQISGNGLKQSTEKTTVNGVETHSESTLGYMLGSNAYNINTTDGLCISQFGAAGVQAGQTVFPARGTLVFEAAGTVDFYLLAYNKAQKVDGRDNSDRRHIKVWYMNDQSSELKPLLCANENTNNDFWFNGERKEDRSNGLSPLQLSVRLQHLGSDGTCKIFITYEDEACDDVWIKGILVKRPDLKVTIGRTDKLYYKADGTPNHDNTKLTCFGENKPYQWNFGTAGFSAMDPETNNEVKKVNEHDGRTYICGVGPNGEQLMDHVLVYSDGHSSGSGADKANFDGRKLTNGKHTGYEEDESDNNEHIEFLHPTTYSGKNTLNEDQTGFDQNRRSFFPILSNGLKVNVTGSGWFTVACAAPNGPVKMKVLSSTNGGNAYMNILREFDVPKGNSDTDWKEYKVYLKAHQEFDGDNGFWDGSVKPDQRDPEETQMSLYVVFEAKDGETYTDNGAAADAQLNIHFLQWLNEEPMDYVFQREENPALLTDIQTIERGDETVLRWQASNPFIKETLNDTEVPTFDVKDQKTTAEGQMSVDGSASRIGDNDNRYYWDIAAKPAVASHTEAAQRFTNAYQYTNATKYDLSKKNSEMEFGLPISGSFYRLYPEKNGHVIAYVIPTVAGQTVYVLDETGAPIGQLSNENTAYADWSQSEKAHGVVKTLVGAGGSNGVYSPSSLSTIRLDILVSAGKEYFICGSEPISLAALHWYQTREGDATSATLSNNEDNAAIINDAKNGEVYRNVLVGRSFEANKWASLVLPFSMNELKFQEVFGDKAICIHFTDVDLSTNTVNLTHHYYNMIVAGRPVFVRPSQNVSAQTIYDLTLQAGDVIPTLTNDGGIKFTGSIGKATMPKNSLFMSGNAIKHTTEPKSVNAMRAWIEGGEVLEDIANKPSSPAPVARLLNYDGTLLDEDIATGIESALAEAGMDAAVIGASTVIYNLQGNKVATGAEMQNLPAGVYVVKGKKFIVK